MHFDSEDILTSAQQEDVRWVYYGRHTIGGSSFERWLTGGHIGPEDFHSVQVKDRAFSVPG